MGPVVDPNVMGTPPLGSWFLLISLGSIICPVSDLTPVNVMLLIPELSVIPKLLSGLFGEDGDWKMPLMNTIPLPPVVPIPVIFCLSDVRIKLDLVPSNSSAISSNSLGGV